MAMPKFFSITRKCIYQRKADKTLVRGAASLRVCERYHRFDIPCNSSLCSRCLHYGTPLSAQATHYFLPTLEVLSDFIEVLKAVSVLNSGLDFLLLQSIVNELNRSGTYSQRASLKEFTKNTLLRCAQFCDENCFFQENKVLKEDVSELERTICNTMLYYKKHLEGKVTLVLLSNDAKFIKKIRSFSCGLSVMKLLDFIAAFTEPKDAVPVMKLLQSIEDAMRLRKSNKGEAAVNNDDSFTEHESIQFSNLQIERKQLVKGKLNISRYHRDEGYIEYRYGKESGSRKIHIIGRKALNRALHGDVVAIRILPQSEWRVPASVERENILQHDFENEFSKLLSNVDTEESMKEKIRDDSIRHTSSKIEACGTVVCIIERTRSQFVVSLPNLDENENEKRVQSAVLVIPMDKRIPKIRIRSTQLSTIRNQRFIVQIDSWPIHSFYPNGHYIRPLGIIGTRDCEVSALLFESHLAEHLLPFSPEVSAELPQKVELIDDINMSNRRDLRQSHPMICSIDPPGCQDIDDALSYRSLPNDGIEIGVHIADVSHFIKSNGYLDQVAQQRGTSVYLPDRRLDMLPECLSTNLCSLRASVDRFAVSILWHFYPSKNQKHVMELDETKTWIGRYGCGEKCVLKEDEMELRFHLLKLRSIARQLYEKRKLNGALSLFSSEVSFQLDENNRPELITDSIHLEIHDTIAEWMIFANQTAARQISNYFPNSALLRKHSPPDDIHFLKLKKIAFQIAGIELKTRNNREVSQLLENVRKKMDKRSAESLSVQVTRCMSEAQYFRTEKNMERKFQHYGLAVPYYTHFTSPIRRYADIIVHRQLLATIDKSTNYKSENIDSICDRCNQQTRRAKSLSKKADELFLALLYARSDLPISQRYCDACVSKVKENGIVVFIPKLGIKAPIHFIDRDGEKCLLPSQLFATSKNAISEPSLFSKNEMKFSLSDDVLRVKNINLSVALEFKKFQIIQVSISCDFQSQYSRFRCPQLCLTVTQIMAATSENVKLHKSQWNEYDEKEEHTYNDELNSNLTVEPSIYELLEDLKISSFEKGGKKNQKFRTKKNENFDLKKNRFEKLESVGRFVFNQYKLPDKDVATWNPCSNNEERENIQLTRDMQGTIYHETESRFQKEQKMKHLQSSISKRMWKLKKQKKNERIKRSKRG
eukprot:g2934.t1